MMLKYLIFLLFLVNLLCIINCDNDNNDMDQELNEIKTDKKYKNPGAKSVFEVNDYKFWPNATVPFYVDTNHYDSEQHNLILQALHIFSYKTCLKFLPVMARPEGNQHVMVFENPTGIRKCVFNTRGHSVDEPHSIILGYDCLRSPDIDTAIMKGLGFPFEHNRPIRDSYISVQHENIEPGYIELFAVSDHLPQEMRWIPYDLNSVMHFSERAFTKNGHRTIIIKNHNITQNREGLSSSDLRKIDMVYGPDCLQRDRQEKLELCQSFPGVARRKRSVGLFKEALRSLRVNPDITPPPVIAHNNISGALQDLGVELELQEVTSHINRISDLAIKHNRASFCNDTKAEDEITPVDVVDVIGVIKVIDAYVKSVVQHAIDDTEEFCTLSKSIDKYKYLKLYNNTEQSTESADNQTQANTEIAGNITQASTETAVKQTQQITEPPKVNNETVDRRIGNDTVNLEAIVVGTAKNNSRKKREITDSIAETPLNKDASDNVQNVPDNNSKKKTEAAEIIAETPMKADAPENAVQSVLEDFSHSKLEEITVYATNRPPNVVRRQFVDRRFRVAHKTTTKDAVSEESGASLNLKIDNGTEETATKEETKKKSEEDNKDDNKGDEKESKKEAEPKLRHGGKKHKVRKDADDDADTLAANEDSDEEAGKDFVPRVVELTKENKEFYSDRKWPDGIVYYMIENNKYAAEKVRNQLHQVNRVLTTNTCVKLKEIDRTQLNKYEDYLYIDTSADYITGRVGGKQNFGAVELFEGGQAKQYAAMMVMAMLGFYFEVSRHDRDKYIKVHMRHVRADKLHHYEKLKPEATLRLPYDYLSATHPSWQFWRHVGKTGISTVATFKDKDPDGSLMKQLGQHSQLLSELDLVKINSVYGTQCFRGARKWNGRRGGPPKHSKKI